MFSIRLPEDIESELISCAKDLGKPKAQIVKEALVLYLEDLKDYIKAKRIVSKKQPTISH